MDENGNITTYAYNDAGQITSKIEAAGSTEERITEYTYDDGGNQLTIRTLGDADTAEALTTMVYDDYSNMISITDPEGGFTQFTHDLMGNVLTKTDARGKVWTYEYDDAGNLVSTTDPLNGTTAFEYDGVGNKVLELDAEGNQKTFAYDIRDNLTESIDAEGNKTTFEYTFDGKLTKQIDPEGSTIQYRYNTDGILARTIDGSGNEITMEYDELYTGCGTCSGSGVTDQPSKVIYPTFERDFRYDNRGRKILEIDRLSGTDSYTNSFTYDSIGNLFSTTDKEDKETHYEYDALNRLIAVIDALGNTTEYEYDNRDNLISLEDAEGNITRFEYDRNNRLVKEIRPMGQETSYTYDQAGNLETKIDAKNQKTRYSYDNAGRLTGIEYFPANDHENPVKIVSFEYDKVGNLTGYDDGTTSAIYGYDDTYRKVSETVDYSAFDLSNAYTYYKNGLKKSFTGPDGIEYTYTYDAGNKLTGVNIPDTGFITYNAYTWNRPSLMTLPGGSTKHFSYDPLMRLKSIDAKDPAQNAILNYQYAHDKMDNIIRKNTEHGDYQYAYDDLYRLTTADNPLQDDEAFTYDGVGNRLTSADTAGDWLYNQNNELGAYDDVSYEYDVNGNMIKKTVGTSVTSYVYNTEDRLTQVWNGEVNTGSLIAEYYYDSFGRRLWKDVGGIRTHFHYTDEGLIGEYDADGNEIKTYGYKPGSMWTTDPLFMKEGGQYYFYQNDHLGKPQKLTVVNGAVVWSAKYSSFGEATVEIEAVKNDLRLPGQMYDEETGLHYNNHRFYDPTLGRYLRVDPVGMFPEDVVKEINHLSTVRLRIE